MTKALILAGGLGTRLGEITQSMPKPMLNIDGKPLIKRIVDRLYESGIKDIVVNVHYKSEDIMNCLGDRVLYHYTPQLLGHGGTILALRSWLEGDDFFVINGDTISDVSYKEMQTLHKEDTITMFMDEYRCAGTWLYCPSFFKQPLLIDPYRPEIPWQDIGTPERLAMAKEKFK